LGQLLHGDFAYNKTILAFDAGIDLAEYPNPAAVFADLYENLCSSISLRNDINYPQYIASAEICEGIAMDAEEVRPPK
jgi:hypothetical protein